VRFGIFYEHQLPRPWGADAEHRLLQDALEQIEIADRVGFDRVWEVEHHFLEEYSHSSAPEVFLGAASQRTKRIRLGHGIVQLPPQVNHPARIAERVATLDLISGGRVDFGTGESSSAAELGGFGVERERKRDQWHDALDAITRMFVEEPFAGWESEWISMPQRNVIPKPLQRPHPPLWVACSRRETIHLAARTGIGALSFSFVEPEDAGKWVREYYDLLASPECVPAGFAVNPNVTVVLPMMCHRDEATAIERGIDGAHFFGYSLAHYYGMGKHSPGATDVHAEFVAGREGAGFAREIINADMAPLGVRVMQAGVGSLRGAIGTPDQIRELARRYEAVGVDQIVFVLQAGGNRHEHICESLELFSAEVLPEFAEAVEAREAEKAERLAPAIEAALARRVPARSTAPPYVIDEPAEVARSRRARGGRAPAPSARDIVRRTVESGLRRLVEGQDDAALERRFGARPVQQALFTGMASAYEPDAAAGFAGDIVYELTHGLNGRPANAWTITVADGRAKVHRGRSGAPRVLLRMSLPTFARLAGGVADPMAVLMEGGMDIEGDLEVAGRLSEMFGGPSSF